MKRIIALIMLLALAVPMFVACDEATEASSEAGESSATESKEEIPMNPDTNAPKVWTEEYADEANGFKDASEVYKLQAFSNGIASEEYAKLPSGDTRYIFEGKDKSRAVVLPEGYALTLPSANITADFSLGALRSKFKGDGYMLTVSYEDQNPYGANEKGWNIYLTEWVERYLVDNNFLMENSIRRTRQAGVTEDLLEGYVVHYYDMQINVATKMEYDCYSIALIRPKAHYKYFYMLVLKSGDPMYEQMDEIVKSFKEIQKKGTSVNSVGAYELKIPEHWNEETKAYYNKLLTQNTVDMGMFYQKNDPVYVDWFYQSIESELAECFADHDADSVFDRVYLTEVTESFLRGLSKDDRVLFVRRYWYGYAVKDLSREVHQSPSRVAKRLFRLRAELKAHLEEKGISLKI